MTGVVCCPATVAMRGMMAGEGPMSWLHEIDDISPLRGLFRDVDVIPDTVDLHDIVIDRDGPVVHLRADLRAYPEPPPAKWRVAGHDTVQITLSVLGVTALDIAGVGTVMAGELRAGRDPSGGGCTVWFDAHPVHLRADGRHVAVTSVRAYRQGAAD